MLLGDYLQAQEDINAWKALPKETRFTEQSLARYINAIVTLNGGAWCMDTYVERAAMTSLVINILKIINEQSD